MNSIAKLPNPLNVFLTQFDVNGVPVLLDVFDLLAAWNGNDVIALFEEPRKR